LPGYLAWFSGVALIGMGAGPPSAAEDAAIRSQTRLDGPFVVAQLPAGSELEKQPPVAGGMLRGTYGLGARLLLVAADGSARVLSRGFHSACDPDVSFDAARILFAAKPTASDPWNIYEMAVDGSGVRQITKDLGDCRSPCYQSSLYTLKPLGVPSQPEYHITFVAGAGTMNEYGEAEATHLYSCKLDGSAVRRLTFNLSSDADPFLMDDGRLVFASWQRARLDHGLLGRVGIFGVNLDGADLALYAGYEGRRIKQMPCATESGLVVFVEADRLPWDGAGCLSSVCIRRPLHSYRRITKEADGLFHSPSPLPDGRVLVSRRPRDGSGTHGVWRLDPLTGEAELVFDDPRYHEIQAIRESSTASTCTRRIWSGPGCPPDRSRGFACWKGSPWPSRKQMATCRRARPPLSPGIRARRSTGLRRSWGGGFSAISPWRRTGLSTSRSRPIGQSSFKCSTPTAWPCEAAAGFG